VPQPRGTFGTDLRELRESKGVGLRELARQAGLSVSHLSYIENGDKVPGPEVLGRLSRALQVDPKTLLRDRSLSAFAIAVDELTGVLRRAGPPPERRRREAIEQARRVIRELGEEA
jgi:transcriptional regulator with XRE-family HTH domain